MGRCDTRPRDCPFSLPHGPKGSVVGCFQTPVKTKQAPLWDPEEKGMLSRRPMQPTSSSPKRVGCSMGIMGHCHWRCPRALGHPHAPTKGPNHPYTPS